MSYPTKYTRQYDYVAYQNANPTRPLPATSVHADLNQAALSSSEIVEFLKTAIRSDGELANESVGLDQLTTEVKASLGDLEAIEELLAGVADAQAAASAAATSASSATTSAASASGSASSASSSATSAGTSATNAAASAASAGAAAAAAATTAATAASRPIRVFKYSNFS